MEKEKPSFEFVNLLPTMVFGPDELATNVQELMTSSRETVLEVENSVKRNFPEAVEKGILKLEGSMTLRPWRLDTRETEEAFGWKPISFEETVKELVRQYLGFFEAERK